MGVVKNKQVIQTFVEKVLHLVCFEMVSAICAKTQVFDSLSYKK